MHAERALGLGMSDSRNTGVPSRGALVAVRRDDAVAVRVDERVVVRGAVVPRPPGSSSRTATHGVLRLAVDRVAVDVEVVRELVVLLELLQLRRRLGDTTLGSRMRMFAVVSASAAQRARPARSSSRRTGSASTSFGDAVRRLRRRDVALSMYGFSTLPSLGLTCRFCIDPRDRSSRRRSPTTMSSAVPMSGRRQRPIERGDDEQDRDEQRAMTARISASGDGGVDVGVAGAGEQSAGAACRERRVLVEPEADGLQQRGRARRSWRSGRARRGEMRTSRPDDADAAVEVARSRAPRAREMTHDRGREADDAVQSGSVEDVEADVEVELRVRSCRTDVPCRN